MWEKKLYIATQDKIEENDYGYEIQTYNEPQEFAFNYQPSSGLTNYLQYGKDINKVYVAYISRSIYDGVFHEGDVAYLSDGKYLESELDELVENEDKYCSKANYRITSVLPQNLKIRIDFTRI